MAGARVAVVTGASSGIGEATARELTRRGWTCVLLARRADRLEALASEIGGEWEVCDVADRQQVDEVAARVLMRHPAIGLLVNNAGIGARGSFLDIDAERIEEVTAINYLGGVWCTRAFEPGLRAGTPSHVVNVASVAATVTFAPAGAYSASKHAQLALSRSLAALLRGSGIQVHTILPGFVETEARERRLFDLARGAGLACFLHQCGKIAGQVALYPETGADCVSLDAGVSIGEVCDLYGSRVTVAGNVDVIQSIRGGSEGTIRRAVEKCVGAVKNPLTRYILMPSCDLPADTRIENVRTFLAAAD